jgi:hypothetical protein
MHTKFWQETPKRDCSEEVSIIVEILLKRILIKWDERVLTKIHLPKAGSCEHGNEPSGSIKYWKFLD